MSRVIALATGILFVATFAAPASAAAKLRYFQSPSGNIACLVHDDGARCDISKRDWKAPGRPRSCDLDWGSYLAVGTGSARGHFACVGDTVRNPKARKLAAGASVSVGKQRCSSRTDGVRCVNGRDHGFFISRQSYRLF